jgi:hypothetical protein
MIRPLLLMSLLLVAFVSPAILMGCSNKKIAEKDRGIGPKAVIPALDASVPAETATATFALG